MVQQKVSIVIWGASGHALVVADIIRLSGLFNIIGYLDDMNRSRWGERFGESVIRGGGDCLPTIRAEGVENLVVAIGDCAARMKLGDVARSHGFALATIIHPHATIAADASVQNGTVIAAHAVVNPGCSLGSLVIVNTSASVDHECTIGDGAHIGPGARLGGRVQVGPGAWIGIGATIKDRVRIGAHSIIGAGAVVLKDVPESVVAYGVPAKVVGPNVE